MGELLGWLRKLPAYAAAVIVLVVIIGVAGIGYYFHATSGADYLRGSRDSGGNAEEYRWDGGELVLVSATSDRSGRCYVQRQGAQRRSVYVPRTGTQGFFNPRDYAALSPQASGSATITCDRSVRVYAGQSEVARVKRVNSPLFSFGFPALIAIPIIALVLIGGTRKASRSAA